MVGVNYLEIIIKMITPVHTSLFGTAIAYPDCKKKNLFLLRQLQFDSWFFFGGKK
jgi:hypothetical protein